MDNTIETQVIPENSDDMYQELCDTLISNALGMSENAKNNRRKLFDKITVDLFTNEDMLIYKALSSLKGKAADGDTLDIDKNYLYIYLNHNINLISQGKEKGLIDNIEMLNDADDVNLAYIANVIKQYEFLVIPEKEILNTDDYVLQIESFLQVVADRKFNLAINKSKQILTNTDASKHKKAGYDDASTYLRKEINNIDAILHSDNGAGFVEAKDVDLFSTKTGPVKLANFDLLDVLNSPKYIGGIYSDMFYNILAPTKGGKSKFCARMAHSVLVSDLKDGGELVNRNVTIWPYEGGKEAFLAQLIVIHTEWLARQKSEVINGQMLNQKMVLFNSYNPLKGKDGEKDYEQKALEIKTRVENAANDLLNNPAYGKIYFIDKPLKAETFVENLVTGIKLNGNSQFVVVDYLQLITSEGSNTKKNEIISKAYQDALAFCKQYHVCFVSPSQMKQDAMTEMANSKEDMAHEVRTFGGESAEIIRTPDYNIALYASIQDILEGKMELLSVPSRMSAAFPRTKLLIDLGLCIFQERPK